MNEKQKRILMALIGVLVTGCSVGLFQMASLGTDPFTSFVTGICNLFNMKFGVFYTIICACIFFVVFLLDKHYIGIATFFNLFGNGFAADATTSILSRMIPNLTITHRIILLVLGIVVMCFAAALYFTADLGVSVYDAISIIMSDKKIASFRICRIGTDSVCVAIGFALKASIGVGTIVTALFMGPLIQVFKTYVAEPLLYGPQRVPLKN
jgi:uncharacterized membrane protein YczE